MDVADRLRSSELPTVAAMVLALTGNRDDIELALGMVERTSYLDPVDAAFLAADWPAPQRIRDRVRLYAANAGLNRDNWLPDALDADLMVDVDADRLAGQLLIRELRRRVLPPAELLVAMARIGEDPPPIDTVDVHRTSVPLCVAVSRGWLALGDSDRARQALGPASRLARDTASQLILDISRVDIARRLRLDEVARLKRAALLNLTPSEVPRVIEAVGLLDGSAPRPSKADQPEEAHLLWRAAPRLNCKGFDEPFHRWPNVRAALARCGPSATAVEVGLALDAVESSLLSDDKLPSGPLLDPQFVQAWAQAHPGQPEQAVRLLLRAVTLLGAQPDGLPDAEAYSLYKVVGPHHLANLALEEGELLALRLPDRGVRLLNASVRWFGEVEDSAGAAVAEAAAALAEVRAGTATAVDRVRRIHARLQAMAASADAGRQALRPRWDGWLIRLGAMTAGFGHASQRREAPSPELPDWTPPALVQAPLKAEASIRLQAIDLGRTGVKRTLRLRFGSSSASISYYSSGPHPQPYRGAERSGSTTPTSERGQPFVPAIDTPSGSAALETRRPGPTPPARARRRIPVALLALAALLIGTVAASALYLFYILLEKTIGDTRFVPSLVVQAVVFISVLLGITYCAIRILTSGPTVNYLKLDLSECGLDYDIAANGYRKRRWPLPEKKASARLRVRIGAGGEVRHIAPQGKSPGSESYVLPGRPGGPGALSVALDRLRDTRYPLHVGLYTPPQLFDVPWEGFLADLLRGIGPFEIARNRLREGYRKRTLRTRFGDQVKVAAPATWRELVLLAVPSRSSAVVLDPAASGLSPGDIAVILALPVDTPVGGRLAIPPSRGEDTPRDLVLEPDALTPEGTFIVVAGCPASERDSASDVNMRDLRRCGADLIEAGAELVVVLPSLPAGLLHECLQLLLADVRASVNLSDTRGCAEVVRRQLAIARPSDAREVTELRAWR